MSNVQAAATVEILPDLSEFDDDARRQLGQVFERVERSAGDTATQVERSLSGAFDGVGDQARRAAGDVSVQLERVGDDAALAADRLDREFETAVSKLGPTAEREMRQLRDEIRQAADAVGDRLPAALEQGEAGLRELGDTAERELDRVEREAEQADRAVSGIGNAGGPGGATAGVGGGGGGFPGGIVGKAALAIAAITAIIGPAIDAAAEVQQLDNATAQLLENGAGASGQTAAGIETLATSLSDLAAIDDDDIQGSLNVLLRFQGIGPTVFEPASRAVLDLSAATGQALPASAQTLGRALENPIAAISRLGRAGITFSEDQQQMIRTLVETGDVAGAQGVVIEAVMQRVGGAAEANATPIERFRIGVGNLQEALGAGLLSGLESVEGGFTEVFGGLEEVVGGLGSRLGELLATVGPPILDVLGQIVDAADPLLGALIDGLGEILPPVVDLAGVLLDALKPAIDALVPIIDILAPLIGDQLARAVVTLTPTLELTGNLLATVLEVVEPLLPAFFTFSELLGGPALLALEALNPLIESLSSLLDTIAGPLAAVTGAIAGPLGAVGDVISGVGDSVNGLFSSDPDSSKFVVPFAELTEKGAEAEEQMYALGDAVAQGPLTNLELLALNVPTVADAIAGLLNAPAGQTGPALYDLAAAAEAAGLSGEDLDAVAQELGISSEDLTGFITGTTTAVDGLTASIESNLPQLSSFGTGMDEAAQAFDVEDFKADLADAMLAQQEFVVNLQSLPPQLRATAAELGPAAAEAFASMTAAEQAALETQVTDFNSFQTQIPGIVGDMAGPLAAETEAAVAGMNTAFDAVDFANPTSEQLTEAIKTVGLRNPELQKQLSILGADGGAAYEAGLQGAAVPGTETALRAVIAQLQASNVEAEAGALGGRAGGQLGAGVAQGVRDSIGSVNAALDVLIDRAESHARYKTKSASPSQLFAERVGRPISEGIAAGILEQGGMVANAVAQVVDVPVPSNIGIVRYWEDGSFHRSDGSTGIVPGSLADRSPEADAFKQYRKSQGYYASPIDQYDFAAYIAEYNRWRREQAAASAAVSEAADVAAAAVDTIEQSTQRAATTIAAVEQVFPPAKEFDPYEWSQRLDIKAGTLGTNPAWVRFAEERAMEPLTRILDGAEKGNYVRDRLLRRLDQSGGPGVSTGGGGGGSFVGGSGGAAAGGVTIQGVPNMIVVQVEVTDGRLNPGDAGRIGQQVRDAIDTVAGRESAVTASLAGGTLS